ncbi:hypothetical protein [Nocardiopsis sp. FIRDI 009]|uniref:hypothetical protein n=1 Tax=Nocardiopsis sp. FIRDI 009 TaxID=714197 RepID=UPI000E22C2F3|nr:hypothetical protein [Nocardiopsis sp. FIRDI 009]
MPQWEPRRADQLKRRDIVLMPNDEIRAVTDANPPYGGSVHIRLGTTWYAFPVDTKLPVDIRRWGVDGADR